MQNALAGTPELGCIYRQNSAAARAAGIKKSITWEEYHAMLLEVASVMDAGRILCSNPQHNVEQTTSQWQPITSVLLRL